MVISCSTQLSSGFQYLLAVHVFFNNENATLYFMISSPFN